MSLALRMSRVAFVVALCAPLGCVPVGGSTPDASSDAGPVVDAPSPDAVSDDAFTPDAADDRGAQDVVASEDATRDHDATADVAVDAPRDATVDATMDVTVDTTVDVTVDAAADVTVDTTVDVARDVAVDASRDGSADASVVPDDTARDAETPPTDAPDLPGLPPVEVFDGPLPTPSRAQAGWAPRRITHRAPSETGLADVDRLVFAYSDRRLSAVTTERWVGGAWTPYESTAYAYDAMGRISERDMSRYSGRWALFQRWRYEHNADGTLRAERRDVLSGASWVETAQRVWQWVGALPGWQRYQEAPAPGMASVLLWENAYDYDAAGRLTGYLHTERRSPTDPRLTGGRHVLTVRPTGHLDRDTFVFASIREDTVYRYNRAGALVEVAGPQVVDRYLYDAAGRLQFVRTYTRFVDAWSLTAESEFEHTTDGSDATFAMNVDPFEAWRRDHYGRGDLVDHYRR